MILKVIPFGVENATEETVKVRKQDKVSLLRRLISDKYGKDKCPLDRLRLIYMGKVLEDLTADGIEAILYNTYGVKENQVINISLKVILSREPSVAPATITSAAASESSFVPPLELRASTSSSVEPEKQPEPEFVIPPELIEEEPYICPRCKNDPRVTKCKECGCQQCGGKEGNPMICDQCNMYWHVECVGLDKLPEEDEWFCPECENKDVDIVIGEGQGIKSSSKKAKMPSANQTKKWGGGMACAGKQVSCIIVDKDHLGPIPGVHIGQTWKYRLQCSEWGVHRPPISGIAGGKMGCPSIVLAAGYPEDADDGDEFTYTGSGGRDLTGNKRTGSQTADQALDRFNLALAKTCHAGLNEKFGADAGDLWYKSGPIRVVRSDKLKRHHPMFAPAEGQRYDGIYKLVKYWKERGHSGHLVWRFLMRRDDPDPAPWTVEGKRRIAELGLRMVFPNDDDKGKGKGKVKAKCYEIPADVVTMMRQDAKDERVWEDVMEQKFWSEYEFLHYVFSTAVVCCVCSETITDPVTTSCGHIACLTCLRKVTSKEPRCPWCRSDLKDPETGKVSYAVNGNLVAVLKRINWAYAGGRLPEKYSSATVGSTVKEMKGVQASKGKNRGEDKAPTNVSSKARGKLERKRKEVLVEEEEEEELRDADVGLEDEEEVDELDNDDDFIETWNKKGKARTKAARRATRKRKAILEMEEEEEVVMDLLDDDDDFVVAPRKKGKGKGKAKAAPRATRKRKVILEMEDDDDGFVVTPRKKGQAALRTGRKRRAILEEEEEEQEEVNELADDLVETPLEGVETVQKDMAARSWRSKRKWEIYVEI